MPNASLDNLAKEVSEDKDVKSSAITVLGNLSTTIKDIKQQLADQGVQNATLDQLATDLDASSNDLAAAIANVPV